MEKKNTREESFIFRWMNFSSFSDSLSVFFYSIRFPDTEPTRHEPWGALV